MERGGSRGRERRGSWDARHHQQEQRGGGSRRRERRGSRDAQHHQQEQRGRGSNQGRSRGSAVQQGRGSNQGRSGGQVGPILSAVQQGSGGRGPGAAPTYAQAVSSQTHKSSSSSSPANVVPDPVVPTMESLTISEPALPSSSSSLPGNTKAILPMKRPDNGGTLATKKLSLLVNHFAVTFDPKKIIWQYDVDVKPTVDSRNERPVKLSKFDLYLIRRQLSLDYHGPVSLEMTAYDGNKNIFSVEELRTGDFTVKISESSYQVTLKLVKELRVSQLNDFLSGNGSSVPRDILQAMDLVMKENPKRRMFSLTRSSTPINLHQEDDLGRGIIASTESKYSLKLTSKDLALCLDYSVIPVRKSVPVIEYLRKQIRGFNIKEFGNYKKEVELALKGLKVYKSHLDTQRRHTIAGLTPNGAQDILFSIKDQQVSLVDYFMEKYRKDIMYQGIPCLELGKKNGSHLVPMELCDLAEGQRYPKESLGDFAKNKLKKLSMRSPTRRRNKICDLVQDADGPCCGPVVTNFGMEVSTKMTKVEGRVLKPPMLIVSNPRGIKIEIKVNEKCQWNLVRRRVAEGKQIDRWAVLHFTSDKPRKQSLRGDPFIPSPRLTEQQRLRIDEFIQRLIDRCKNLGIIIGEPLHHETASMDDLCSEDVLQKILENIQRRSNEKEKGRLQLLLCVMDKHDPGYGCLKFVSETKVGIMTQCCLSDRAKEARDQYLANLALKINAKLGGHNVEINEPLLHFKGEDVMFVGADVNHPGFKNSTSPSIAAVVASMSWPAPNRYAARICPQDPKTEKIQDFEKMCSELIDSYSKLNKVMPSKIVIFRDGVSETQFDMVLNEELAGVKRAFEAKNYSPTITVVVAQKRHLTRFFPETKEDDNVPPGTVIDSTVVDHSGFHFHLCSHYGSIGTSKAAQYQVLLDEHGFTSDHIQQLVHSMCFTFARCTNSVSLIPPVYYADLAAYRGRLYQEVLDRQSQASSSSSFSSSAPPSQPSAPAVDSYRVHPDLQDSMFFI